MTFSKGLFGWCHVVTSSIGKLRNAASYLSTVFYVEVQQRVVNQRPLEGAARRETHTTAPLHEPRSVSQFRDMVIAQRVDKKRSSAETAKAHVLYILQVTIRNGRTLETKEKRRLVHTVSYDYPAFQRYFV